MNFMTLVGKCGEKAKGLINILVPPNLIQPPKITFSIIDQKNVMKGLLGMLIEEFMMI